MIEGGHVSVYNPVCKCCFDLVVRNHTPFGCNTKLYVSKIIGLMFVSAILMQLGFLGCITFRTIQWGVMLLMDLFIHNSYLGLARILFSCWLGDWAKERIVFTKFERF